MIPPETYLAFHLVFTLPVTLLLVGVSWQRGTRLANPTARVGLAVILLLAMTYTTPWDNLLIEADVWWYGEDVVWFTLWAAPFGEYLFFVIQPIITVLFLSLLPIPTDTNLRVARSHRALGAVAGLGVSALGIVLVGVGDAWLYLGSMVAWAGPVLGIQWAFGWTHLWRARRTVAVAVAVPTLYFWVADWTAIQLGLWTISGTHTVGVAPFGFPIEEAFFFVVTNLFVVQGYVLYLWLVAQWSAAVSAWPLVRHLPSPESPPPTSGD